MFHVKRSGAVFHVEHANLADVESGARNSVDFHRVA